MQVSDIDALSDEEVVTMAALLGAQFVFADEEAWYVDMPGYEYHGAGWHPIETCRDDGIGGFSRGYKSHAAIARAYVKWALTSGVTP